MDAQFSISGLPALRFSEQFPPGMEKYRIPATRVYAASGTFGEILIQEISASNFVVWYCVFQIRQDISLEIRSHGPVLKMQLMLESDLEIISSMLDKVVIKESCFNMYYLPQLEGVCHLKKDHIYTSFSVQYTRELLNSLQFYFPLVATFTKKMRANEPALLLRWSYPFNKEIREIMNHILHYEYDAEILLMYTDHYIRNLFLLLFSVASKNNRGRQEDIAPDVAKMYKVRERLEADLVNVPYLDKMAKDLAMSTSKLNKYFTKLFAQSPKEYWKEKRLEKAAEELKSTKKPVKQIVMELGYKEGTFFDAFKRKFKMTPYEWRNKFLMLCGLVTLVQ